MAEERQIILDIQANTGKLNTRLEGIDKDLRDQTRALKELNEEFKGKARLDDAYLKRQQEIKKTSQDLRKERRQVVKQLELSSKATNAAAGSNEKLRAQLALLTKEYDKLGKAERAAGTEGERLQKQIRSISDELKANEKAVGDNRRNVGNYESAFDGLTSKLGGGVAALAGPAGIVFAVEALGDALIEGGKAIVEIEREFTELRGNIQRTTGAIGDELDKLSAAYSATAETFQVETDEINKAVISLRDNFGTELPRAIELVQTGLLGVADQSGFLGLVTDELSKLVGLGISEDSAIAFLVEATNRGINPDILAEPLLALREQTPATLDALNAAFGPSGTQRLLDTFANDPIKGIQAVSNRFAQLDSTSREAGLLLADVFKSPGEDAIALAGALGELNFNLEETVDATNELTEQQIKQLEVETELAIAKNEISKELAGLSAGTGNLTTQIETGLLKAFLFLVQEGKNVINFFVDLYNESLAFRAVIQSIVVQVRLAVDFLKLAFNQLVDGFQVAGKLIRAVFTGNFSQIPDILGDALSRAKDNVVDFATEAGQDIGKAIDSTINGTAERLSNEVPKVLEKGGKQAGISFTSGLSDGLKEGGKKIQSELDKLRERLGGISIGGIASLDDIQDQAQIQKRIDAERTSGQSILNERAALDAQLLAQAQKAANDQVNVFRKQSEEEIAEAKRKNDALAIEQQRRLSIAGALNNAITATSDLFRRLSEEEIAQAQETTAAQKVAGVAQASIDTYVAANRALASGLPIPANFIAAAVSIATGLANVRQILGFATGGVIPESARNLQRPRSNGDDTLITVQSGKEAVVNTRQIAKIGAHRFRAAGVPGFATGGVVGSSTNLATLASRQAAEADAQGMNLLTQLRNMPTPVVTVKDISRASNRVRVKQNTSRL